MNLTAERIRQLRKKKGLSQAELAVLAGVKNNTVSTWERGTRKPDFNALMKLSDIFEVPYEYILGSSDDETPRVKPTSDQLSDFARSALADEIYDSVKLYCCLGAKSQKLVAQIISCAYKLDEESGDLNSEELFQIRILPRDE